MKALIKFNNVDSNYLQQEAQTLKLIKTHLTKIKSLSPNKIANFWKTSNKQNFLLIGPHNSGKKTLLHNLANYTIDTFNMKNHDCRAAALTHMNIFNIPSKFTTNHSSLATWEKIIKTFAKTQIHGVIVSLNLYDIISQHNPDQYQQISDIIQLLTTKINNPIKIFVIINHLDTIIGFNEFFNDLTQKELNENFGVTLNNTINNHNLNNKLSTGFDKITKYIQEQISYRINKLHTTKEIARCLEFPMQFKNIKSKLLNTLAVIFNLSPGHTINLAGIFFISNRSNGLYNDNLHKITDNVLQNNATKYHAVINQQVFFLHNLFTKNIIANNNTVIKQNKAIKASQITIMLLVSLGLLIAGVTTIHHDLKHLKAINILSTKYQNQLQKFTTENNNNLSTILELQQQHKKMSFHYKQMYLTKINLDFLPYIQEANDNIEQLALITKQTVIIPYLNHTISQPILNATNLNSKVYQYIKIYMDLIYPKKLTISNQVLMSQLFTEQNQQQLLSKIQKIITQEQIAIIPNHAVIKKITELLQTQDNLALIINNMIIKTMGDDNQTMPPRHLQKNNFIEIYSTTLPAIVAEYVQLKKLLNLTIANYDLLLQQAQHKYLDLYNNFWQEYDVANLPTNKIYSINDMNATLLQLNQLITKISNRKKLIIDNTSAFTSDEPAAKIFNAYISKYYNNNSLEHPIFINKLTALNKYIKEMLQQHNPNAFMFNEVRKAFLQQESNIFQHTLTKNTKQNKLFIWLNKFMLQVWNLHIQQAMHHINDVWIQEVYPYYNQIKQQYPLGSQPDLSLASFNKFFGPNGIMEDFYTNYIQPFYNTQQAKWQPKTYLGTKLKFDNTIPEMFIRHQLIKSMYFNNGNLQVAYTITPHPLPHQIKNFELSINQETIDKYSKNNYLNVVWPFTDNNNFTRLAIETVQGKNFSINKSGPWGLFKLLAQAKVTKVNSNQYQLEFDLHEHQIIFTVKTTKKINPLNNNVVQSLRINNNLTAQLKH